MFDVATFTPSSEEDLSYFLRDRHAPVSVKGGGTKPIGDSAGDLISTSKLSGIAVYEPGALTLVAGAGTPIADIEATLAKENQRLAFEPMDYRTILGAGDMPTLGGVVATNTSGPRRIQAGACRDFCLGVRFVDGAGNIVSNGGRVMKNVTGYDLVKLMSGSWGTLGVMTEVSLKVLPIPETQATVFVEVGLPSDAVAAMSAALGSPFDVTGAAYINGQVAIRVEGFENSVSYRCGQLQDRLSKFGEINIELGDQGTWDAVRDVSAFDDPTQDLWRISIKPTDGPSIINALPGAAMMDWGGGLIWVQVPSGTDVRRGMQAVNGHALCVRGPREWAFAPLPPAQSGLQNGIRAKFDPKEILNQGCLM